METHALKIMVLITFLILSFSAIGTESFLISIQERSVRVESPRNVKKTYSVIVQNKSLSDIVAKFHSMDENLKFVSVKSGASKSVDFLNESKNTVMFQILSPAFQELVLEAGKNPYEVPPVQ